ncbi:hypothetical protein Tco_0048755, partial [Tanacetum coccineum]
MNYVALLISAKYLHFFLNELLLHEYAGDGVCSYFKAEQSEDKDMLHMEAGPVKTTAGKKAAGPSQNKQVALEDVE